MKVVPVELSPEDAVPVLKEVIAPAFQGLGGLIFRDHMPLKPDAPLSDFIIEARKHPVFELRPIVEN